MINKCDGMNKTSVRMKKATVKRNCPSIGNNSPSIANDNEASTLNKTWILTFLVIILPLYFTACEPFEKVSEVPSITFKEFELFEIDTFSNTIKVGKLTFSFIDGNADIGVNPDLYSSNDSINFYLIPFEKADGQYLQADEDTLEYQIRYNEKLDRVGQNKTIKGEISLIIYYFIDPPYDTLRYDFYIYDRARNQSNIESTSDIGFN